MEKLIVLDPTLTEQDRLILEDLRQDISIHAAQGQGDDTATETIDTCRERDSSTLSLLQSWNNPDQEEFRPTIAQSVDYDYLVSIGKAFNARLLQPYIRVAKAIVRVETDVVMLTDILLYLFTSVPSALVLFVFGFSWTHGVLHFIMQVSYMGGFSQLIHNHIHQGGVLRKKQPFALFDNFFPYILGPLMGQSWNSFYYHHVKHHHVEGNGPNDLSSTIRYQRDSAAHFFIYLARFVLLTPIELPLYFIGKRQYKYAFKNTFWRAAYYVAIYQFFQRNPHSTLFVFILPHVLLQVGLVTSNWAQHAFVDEAEPGSDYRSSITTLDATGNRYGYNDGYHTSHHLNPRRHWRDNPTSFVKSKEIYASQQALIFHNIDYTAITIRLLLKDHVHLAKCMVPMGEQVNMSLDERVNLLKRLLRKFTEEEIKEKVGST